MAIAAGAEEQSQDPQLPTPGPADPVGIRCLLVFREFQIPMLTVCSGLQYARLHTGDVLDQDCSHDGTYCFLVQVLRNPVSVLLYSCSIGLHQSLYILVTLWSM